MGMVNSNFLPATTGLSLGNQNQLWNAALNNISIGGQVTYNGVVTQGAGITVVVAQVDLINQRISYTSSNQLLYTVPSNALSTAYRFSWTAKVVVPASTSSTLGALGISYTEGDLVSSGVQFAPAFNTMGAIVTNTTANVNNLNGVLFGLPVTLNCAPGTQILWSFNYGSSPANAMAYSLHIRLENI